jgi:hypothetical protein
MLGEASFDLLGNLLGDLLGNLTDDFGHSTPPLPKPV